MEQELQQVIAQKQQQNFLAVQTPSDQLKQQNLTGTSEGDNQKLDNISGLMNIGATCYMNSVLQTLFMTPEFRKNLYKWKFNEDEYVEDDCIPYQLQKLFAKMQTKFSDFIDTKGLIKSFQWNQHQEFEQHDVQEFIKKLFDAVEDTLQGTENQNFIKDLYQGSSQSYVKCLECGYESIKEQAYNDVIITVKNIFDKIYNESLEKGFQRYLKPEILQGENAYHCNSCNKKVSAMMGTKFNSFPKIMTIILNRFTYNFFTMQRIKLNDYVSFPFILNLNNYINGYDGIKNKLSEENVDPKYFDNAYIIKPTQKQIHDKKYPSTNATSQVKNAYKKKVSQKTQSTSDFIKKMRMQNNKSKASNLQQDILFLEETGNNNGPPRLVTMKIEEENIQKNLEENKKENQESKKEDIQKDQTNDQNQKEDFNKINSNQQQQIGENHNNKMQEEIQDVNVIQQEKKQEDQDQQNQIAQERIQKQPKQEKLQSVNVPEEKLEQRKKEVEQQEDPEKFEKELLEAFNSKEEENEKLIKDYKKDGNLVYELYSVLVHSGGAYGGHYYVLIKNFSDKKWYTFNDTRVTQFDLRKFADESQGGNNKNAYMLFYRQIENEEKQIKFTDDDIPEYIKQILKKDKQKLEEQIQLEKEKSLLITVRVYYKLDVKLITLSKQHKYQDLMDKVYEEFNLKNSNIKKENVRIRAYKPQQDLMQEVYTGREQETLENLKIFHFNNVCVETKNDQEQFESYDENLISLKVCKWEDKYIETGLEENQLDFLILKLNKNSTLKELTQHFSKKLGFEEQKLAISIQHMSKGQQITEEITCENNMNSSLENLNIYENSILYAEEKNQNGDLQWQYQFDVQQHKINIKFNTPKTLQQQQQDEQNEEDNIKRQEFSNSISIDSRLTVSELKEQICKKLELQKEAIVIRRGGKQGQEVKEGKASSLKNQHFFNGSSIYLEYGLPAKEGEVRLCISLAKQADLQNDNIFHEFQEIGEFPIQGSLTGFQAGEYICTLVKKQINLDLDPNLIRLRERVSNRLTKIYRNKPMKDQQIIDKKQISVEILDQKQDLSYKDVLLYVRFWDQENWKLSDRFEIIISKSNSGADLAREIYLKNQQIEVEKMEGTRVTAIWNFNQYDLLNSQFDQINDESIMLGSQPFHLMNDGYLLIVRDKTKEPRELSNEELQKMGVIIANNGGNKFNKYKSKQQGVRSTGISQPKMEKGLSITVKKKVQTKPLNNGGQDNEEHMDEEIQNGDQQQIIKNQNQKLNLDESVKEN